jgi:PAS domain S-box-containing protein
MEGDREEELLRSVALQNAQSILLARRRAEQELLAAKEALRETAERLRATFNQAAVGFAIAGLDTRLQEVNRKFAEILGYNPEELRGCSFVDLTHPDDVAQTRANVAGLIAGEVPEYSYEKRYVAKGGRVVWTFTAVTLTRDAEGRAQQLVSVIQDITERKGAEEALREAAEFNRSIIESSRDCICVLDLEGRLLSMSEMAAKLLCMADVGSHTGTSWVELWQGTDREAARAAVRAAAAGHTGAFVGSLPMLEGTPKWWDVLVTPIAGSRGTLQKLLAVSRDVTERKELLERERGARAEAERMSGLKDEFLATLSHELRTPLGAILGWSQVIRARRLQGAELERAVDVIERNARAQKRLIEDLLDMSRITSGQIRLDVQPVEPATIAEAALDSARPAAEAKGIRLEKLLDPHAGPISGDPARLQQIVWNLLSNAIKFTPKDGKVQVILERVNSHIELSVADSGIGIDPAFLPQLFDRFRQADASTTRRHGGLGIGLAIAKHLAELHGGTIHVQSDGEGRGATFTLQLPLTLAQRPSLGEERVHPSVAAAAPSPQPMPDLSGLLVLAVDDEADARQLMHRILGDCGARVITAASAREALALAARERPDVLVSDIGMPETDGYDLLKQLRALSADIPAVALTAYARSEDRTRALRAGFRIHIAKPVEPAELAVSVANVAGRAGS